MRKVGVNAGKRIAQGALGVLLVLVFFGWLLIRQTEAFQDHIGMSRLLGWGTWALAWVCLLGGASLLARATFWRSSDSQGSGDPET